MAQGPMAMAEPNFTPLGDEQNDDLPRTFRREKEARAREARERAAQERAAAPSLPTSGSATSGLATSSQATSNLSGHGLPAPGLSGGGISAAPTGYGPAAYSPQHSHQPRVEADPDYAPIIADMPYPASVRRFDVPFLHLAGFFLKAVLAAIPALILLTAILWIAGAALQGFFPDLVKMKVLISFPN